MKIIGKKGYDANLALSGEKVAYYHLPGLFEFYELYRVFLPLFRMHREYFYDWCEIGSIYGAPSDCIWGGGRTSFGTADPRDVLALMREYDISSRLTASKGASCRSKVQCTLSAVFRTGRATKWCDCPFRSAVELSGTYVPGFLFCFIDDKSADRFYTAYRGTEPGSISLCSAGFSTE